MTQNVKAFRRYPGPLQPAVRPTYAGPDGQEVPLPSRPAGESERRVLLLVALAAVIPVLLLTGWAGLLAAGRSRTEARDLAFKTSEQVAQKVSAELGKELEIAQTLAASTSLDSGDLDRFYRTASRLVRSRPLWETVSLATPDGTQIVNLLRPLGASLSADADPKSLAEVIRTKSPAIGGIGGVGPLSGRRLVPLRVPVMRDGNLSYVLTIGLNPSQISGILRHAGAPDDWIGAIVDGSGKIVARTVAEEFEAGRLAAPSSLQAISGGRDGFYAGRTIEGLEMETVLRFLPRTEGWTVHFGIPLETLDGPVKRWIILLLAGGATSLALAFLLAMLIANDIAQRRRAAEERSRLALLLSESRGALAVDAAMLGTWRWDAETGVVQGSARTADLLSLPRSASGGEWGFGQFANALTASERGRLEESLEAVLRTGSSLDVEVLVAAANRPGRWIRLTGRRSELSLESPATVQGVVADIDAQKRAEADRLNLLRRLAEAQENERRRIARELHDELGQTVTGLSLGLKALEHDLNSSDRERTRPSLSWLQDLTRSVGRDLHRLSTDLRPSSLDDLGLSRAVCSLVANIAERHGLDHACRVPDAPERFNADVETAVFRAIQEALTNVIKHARANNVEVTVSREDGLLRASVADDGCGFDIEAVRCSSDEPPLGISGMRERLSLVNGTVRIRSGKAAGTTVDIEVKLEEPNYGS